ncbi:MAG TPA: hypothetical protein VGL38_07075 [bacterium]|jgi:hypothetical protein
MDAAESRSFSAPMSSASGRLVFKRGAANVTVLSETGMDDLYKAEFTEPIPDVKAIGNNVEVTYRVAMSDWLKGWWLKDRTAARIVLNRAIPWQIETKGGVSHLRGDFAEMNIQAISIVGGASDVEMLLPRVTGALPVSITGGASHVKLIHPLDVGVKLHIVGGAAKVTLGEQYLGALAGEIILQTPGYKESAGHIDVTIKGGVSDVNIATT